MPGPRSQWMLGDQSDEGGTDHPGEEIVLEVVVLGSC